ncbi:hypothetical protein KIN20_025177 [Parelaphostrongylus tenuis]|uniref:Uncharacterized protein n=1 Tax=Parelaphostrongylus tenuis TaxID=148309 RepID=A0AAD5QX61_PARTN|nr:hypothetical protein KIN20_025177 [Parelaphostrongylus tenuis]
MEPSSKPDSTDADGEEDIVDLCRILGTKLEEKAKMHNLNALNVKSILHRLIKDPHVLTTLMGMKGDTSDIPSLKVTRSKVKHTATEAVAVKSVPLPRTFLDVRFNDEDDDEDYTPEDVNSEESDDEEEASVATDHLDKMPESETNANGVDRGNDPLDDHEKENDVTEASPYPLRSRVPHIEENYSLGSNTPFTQESFDSFVDDHGQEVLTFVENTDYLDFLQGLHASTPVHENETLPVDDDDPDDEEYNVLTELEDLQEIEKDKDELRMDKFTEIPKREVEGLFLDLMIGSDVEAIRSDLILPKIPSPKKRRTKRRSEGWNSQLKNDQKVTLPVDDPPPDGSYSSSLISGKPVQFKSEELDQLRIQLEQHVQLLTQSVVMCYHDKRLAHVKNQYQLMINELDSLYYAGGQWSIFNISNLGAAIDSCHDIMGVKPVAPQYVKWDPTPFGWSPRPEAALVLGRSCAVIYPDLIPGVQPDLFTFRHIPHSNSNNPFGRLYWIKRMLLPCKTIQQIRNHLRIARLHNEGQVNQRNPLYQIIIQALEGVCHLRFPFERPVARYGTLQMWPEEERPIWYNKFLRNFCTNGPTEIIPRENVSDRKSPDVAVSDAPLVGIPSVYSMSSPTQSNNGIASCSVTYEVDVNFHHNNDHLMSCVDAQPTSYCYESANASFPSSCAVTTAQSQQNAPHAANICISDPYRSKETNVKDELEIHQRPTTSYSQLNSEESHQKLLDSSVTNIGDLMIVDDNAKPDVSALSLNFPFHSPSSSLAEPQFSVFEPNKDFIILPTVHPEEMQLPKSEFSFRPELEEGEIISEESSLDAPKKRGRRSILKNSPSNRGGIKRKRAGTHRKRREHVSKSVSSPPKCLTN